MSKYLPFSGSSPRQPEIHRLCQERNINILTAKGKNRTNPDLIAAIKEYDSKNSSPLLTEFNGLFPQLTVDENQSATKDAPLEIHASDQNQSLQGYEPSEDTGITKPIESDSINPSVDNYADTLSHPDNSFDSDNDDVSPLSTTHGNYTVSLASIQGESGVAIDVTEAVHLDETSNTTYPGPFYLQMLASNLGTYLSRGVISPFTLETQDNATSRPIDLLTKHRNYLPLMTGRNLDFFENQVLVEIILLPAEINKLQNIASLYAFADSVPVSRIKRILFLSKEGVSDFRADAELHKNYFFPTSLVGIIGKDISVIPDSDIDSTATIETDLNSVSKLRRFDLQLGMFGYLKHAPLLRANTEHAVQDYSDEMLIGLHEINAAIATAEGLPWVMSTLLNPGSQKATSAGQLLFTAIVQAIYKGESASYEWGIRLLQEVENQCQIQPKLPSDVTQLRVAKQQLIRLQQGQGNFTKALTAIAHSSDLNHELPKLPFTALVLICKYPSRARASEDSQAVLNTLARFANQSQLTPPLLDQLLAVLGLHFGYSQITRQDPNLKIDSPELAAAAKALNRLRFDIEQPTDRVIVESVFRYSVAGHAINETLDYLRPGSEPTLAPVKLPQRGFQDVLSKDSDSFQTKQQSKQASGFQSQKPAVPRFPQLDPSNYPQDSLAADSAVYEAIILKMKNWFSPEHFEQQLMENFTATERKAIQRLIQSGKSR